MLHRVAGFIARHRMLEPGQRVGVAVSGGADSVFLLHVLREMAPRWNAGLSVVHIDHGIRGAASVADAEFVAQLAATLGLPFHLCRANVAAMGGNLEQAARKVRQAFYAELMGAGTVHRIATGHTQSDQAETVLFRMVRGSGLTGLAGILPVTREGLIRPLLELTRGEIEGWLGEHGIAWREDETNRDPAYARNRLRHEILPLLRTGFNPALDGALANLAALARDEEVYWAAEIARFLPEAASRQPLVLPVSQVSQMSPAVARRLLRRAVEIVKGNLRGINFALIEGVLALAAGDTGHGRIQGPGVDIRRSFDWIRIAPAGTKTAPDYTLPLEIPGSVELPGSSARIVLQVLEKQARERPLAGIPCVRVGDELDWQRLHRGGAPSLELRNWRPGDQYRRVGQSEPAKVKFFFQEARIPLWERGNWPIISFHGEIVWARRFGAAAEFAAGPETRAALHVSETSS